MCNYSNLCNFAGISLSIITDGMGYEVALRATLLGLITQITEITPVMRVGTPLPPVTWYGLASREALARNGVTQGTEITPVIMGGCL